MRLNDPLFPATSTDPSLTDKVLGVVGGLVKLMTLQQIKNTVDSSVTVENLLTSTSTTNALSANQGKALKAAIDAIPAPTTPVTVVDALNSNSTTSALSAAQGKALNDALSGKLNTSAYNDHYKGTYASLVSLQAAHTTAALGDYALVDAGAGDNAHIYIWDAQEGWVQGSQTSLLNTDGLTEGSVKLYFTEGRVRSTLLTGIDLATNAVISATDSVLSAFGKLQKQITDLPSIFARYDQAQTLSDAAKSQALTNIGAKKSYNMLPTKTAAYAPTLADFKDAVDLYDKVYLRMNLTAIGDVTIGTALTSLPNLTEITIRDLGTARATLVEDGTVLNGIKTFTVQNEVKTLVKVGANEWDIIGALT
jgi:hypothetical protein